MQRPMEPTILLYLVEMYGHGIHHSPRNRIDRTAETETTRSTSLQKNLYLSPSASRFGSAKRASYLSISIFLSPTTILLMNGSLRFDYLRFEGCHSCFGLVLVTFLQNPQQGESNVGITCSSISVRE